MKIVHLVDHFHPWMGYQETYLAKRHIEMGHDVLVITANRYGRKPGSIVGTREAPTGLHEEEGIKVQRLPVAFELPTFWAYSWLKGLRQALADFSPDIVHCHEILSFSHVRAAMMRRQLNYRMIVDNHSAQFNVFYPDESRLKKMLKTAFQQGVARSFGRIMLREADAVVAIGEPEREFVDWLFGPFAPEHVSIIRLGADRRRFSFKADARTEIRRANHWNADTVVLGHAGTITLEKGIGELLAALARLPENFRSRVHVHLIGKIADDYLPRLEADIAAQGLLDQVTITAFVAADELADYMSAWDVAVWPGDISNTAIEAMAIGRPVIACRTAYTEYMIERYDAGLLVPRDDTNALAQALTQFINDNSVRLQKGKNAQQAVDSDLNWDKIAGQFVDLYKEILRKD
ncbi:MAG: glycosyltransferase family 4 protein [Anaerolineae bacterium]|nr:glycosyltransferase family 4 protein [Anaerolineae bacterium]